MKNTKQKELVLEIINNSFNHLTAYEVYEQARKMLPNISLGTVYRNLKLLTDTNKIKKIVMDNECDRFDRLDEHAHFICNQCHKIYDIFDLNFSKKKDLDGHLVMNYEIKLEGICKECQEGEKENGIKRK